MRILKLGLISVVVLFVVVTLISLLIPSHIRISRATNLAARHEAVLAFIKSDSGWRPAPAGPQAAATSMSLIEQTDSTLVYRLQQGTRKPVLSGWQTYGAAAADSLTLQWRMDFDLGFWPWQKFGSLLYESTYGRMMEQGLGTLKGRLQGQ